MSGSIAAAENTELYSVGFKDHSSYYAYAPFLETVVADIAVTVAKSERAMARALERADVPPSPSMVPSADLVGYAGVFRPGARWVYKFTTSNEGRHSEGTMLVANEGQTVFEGVKATTVSEIHEAGKLEFKVYYVQSEGVILQIGMREVYSAAMVRANPPIPVLKAPLRVGMSWDYTGEPRIRFTVEGVENVRVPAGEFEAVKIVARKATALQDVEVTWWAKDVGMVKEDYSTQSGYRSVKELARYSTP